MIKRLVRWRGDLSLEIYACINDGEWASYIKASYAAQVDSNVAARIVYDVGHLNLDDIARATLAETESA